MPAAPTISIIDDDAWAREGIKDLIASLGYRTLTFASAEEFLESGCVEMTSCIISDLQMPGMSGLDLQQHIADRTAQTVDNSGDRLSGRQDPGSCSRCRSARLPYQAI